MVDEKIINETIQRMLDAGIDDATIVSTLKDIGMSEAQARQQIDGVRNDGGENDFEEEAELNDDDKLTSMRSELENQSKKSELHETTTHNMLNLHEQKLDDVNKKMDEVREAMLNNREREPIEANDNSLNEKLSELSAQQNALQKLMKDILEVNRRILTELESKK